MRRGLSVGVAAAIALALALAVLQSRSPGQPEQGRQIGSQRLEGLSRQFGAAAPLFGALDANGDGVLDAAEISDAPARLKLLDSNGDGRLADGEIRPVFAGRGRPGDFGRSSRGFGERGGVDRGSRDQAGGAAGASADELASTLMAFDTNEDGRLSENEVPERFQGLFDRADANEDRVLTQDELKRAAAAQSDPATGSARSGRTSRGGRGFGRNFFADPLAAALDADHDDAISADEMRGAAASLWHLDVDNDRRLTAGEIRASFRAGRGRL